MASGATDAPIAREPAPVRKTRLQGRINWWNQKAGWGIVRAAFGPPKTYFAHVRDFARDGRPLDESLLVPDARVSFQIIEVEGAVPNDNAYALRLLKDGEE